MPYLKILFVAAAALMVTDWCNGQMYLESYWESWHTEDYPNDFASFLKDVPAAPVGSCAGVNFVTIGRPLHRTAKRDEKDKLDE